MEADCLGCGGRFKPTHSRHAFCSRRCQSRIAARRRLGIADPGLLGKCRWCDAEFQYLAEGRKSFCSDRCAKISGLLAEIRRKYGITKEEYRAVYHRQGGKCAICRKPERSERNLLLCVDHDHATGHFRGLLCSQCNRAIGLLRDDPRVIESAAEYVRVNRQLKLVIA